LNQFTDLTPSELAALTFIQQQQQQFNYQMQPNKYYSCQANLERVYYHTTTTLPLHVNEIDYDSDNDLDPDWLKEQSKLLINEFADVNDGEKELMKLWNLHCLHFNFISDANILNALESFIRLNFRLVINLNLYNNFLLHLANLFDFELITQEQIVKFVDMFNQLVLQHQQQHNYSSINYVRHTNNLFNGNFNNNGLSISSSTFYRNSNNNNLIVNNYKNKNF
jgi:hypothetical protein